MYGNQQRQTGGRRTKQTSFWTGPDGKRTEEFGGGGIPCLASQPLRGGVAVEAVSTEIVYSLFFFWSPSSSAPSCPMGFFYSLAFEFSFPKSFFLRIGSESAFVLPTQHNPDRNMQPAMQLSLRNALLAPTDAVCLREHYLPRIRSPAQRARNSWGR